MREAAANRKCADMLQRTFPRHVYYKHNDKSAGRPDSTFSWNGVTSWLEFKMLEGNEDVHARTATATHGLAKIQLAELLKLERAGVPAWVIAYRKTIRSTREHLTIYRPTALITVADRITPTWREMSIHDNVLRDLKLYGVAAFPGFDHAAVVALIRQTHGTY